jgi:HAD superfamily hydrolase (TIGR01549 family)
VLQPDVVVFDFDGTLVDSDEALLMPFDRLGIPRSSVVMGSAVAEECDRLGVALDDYVGGYDTESVQPFAGVEAMLARLPRWAILSNKHPAPARRELQRLGWDPELVMCADAFDWGHKALEPMLDVLGLGPDQIALVGDSEGDLRCADAVGCRFVWAGWNDRVRAGAVVGEVAATPADVLGLLGFD